MRRILLAIALLSLGAPVASAALPTHVNWEVRSDTTSGLGDTKAGGGFGGNGTINTAPAAPALTVNAGTGCTGTFYVVLSWNNALGDGPASAQTSTGSISNKAITVTAPTSAPAGSDSYTIYIGTVSGGPYFYQGVQVNGSNFTRSSTPASTVAAGPQNATALGTDRSQQVAFQTFIDNSTITTSIAANVITFTGYSPGAADVGNVVWMLTGTNVTAGPYFITSFSATTWTVAGGATLPTSGTTTNATGYMGGAFATPGMAAGAAISGNVIWLRAGTYTCTSSAGGNGAAVVPSLASGAAAAYTQLRGYQTTRGDDPSPSSGNQPVIATSVATGTYTMVTTSTDGRVRCVTVDASGGAGATAITGISLSTNSEALLCLVKSTSGSGIIASNSNTTCMRCGVTSASGTAAFNTGVQSGIQFVDCEAWSCTCPGFSVSGSFATFEGCIAASCTGGTTDGFVLGSGTKCLRCVSYASGRYGFSVSSANAVSVEFKNCIASFNGNYGYGTTTAAVDAGVIFQTSASYDNGGNSSVSTAITSQYLAANFDPDQFVGFVNLTADPFTNAASGDFSLNTTAGGGASLRAAGFPGLMPRGTSTGYADVGAIQHKNPSANPVSSAHLRGD